MRRFDSCIQTRTRSHGFLRVCNEGLGIFVVMELYKGSYNFAVAFNPPGAGIRVSSVFSTFA